jgi:hypothetical protein
LDLTIRDTFPSTSLTEKKEMSEKGSVSVWILDGNEV